jgi:hypothetical protein
MIKRGEYFGFALEAREPLGVNRYGCCEHLDGNTPFQIRVGRLIHLAHSTHTDLGGDVVRAEARPRRERQR